MLAFKQMCGVGKCFPGAIVHQEDVTFTHIATQCQLNRPRVQGRVEVVTVMESIPLGKCGFQTIHTDDVHAHLSNNFGCGPLETVSLMSESQWDTNNLWPHTTLTPLHELFTVAVLGPRAS
jgi:hypothetical protein